MAKAIKGNFHVCRDTRKVRIYAWKHPSTGKRAWRFAVPDPEAKGGWRYVTRPTKDKASASAEEWLDEQPTGLVWSALPPGRQRFLSDLNRLIPEHEEGAILDYLKARNHSSEIGEAVARFLEFKVAKKNRVTLVMFWRWCYKEKIAGPDVGTVAQRLASKDVGHGTRKTLTPDELRLLMRCIEPEYRVWVALGAFAGCRPEEIAPKKSSGKEGLRHEHIDWTWKVIKLPAHVAKTPFPRDIPMNDALLAALAWAGVKDGMVGTDLPGEPV